MNPSFTLEELCGVWRFERLALGGKEVLDATAHLDEEHNDILIMSVCPEPDYMKYTLYLQREGGQLKGCYEKWSVGTEPVYVPKLDRNDFMSVVVSLDSGELNRLVARPRGFSNMEEWIFDRVSEA